MKNKNLAAMQRAIIMMETAQKMYAKALENMKSELIAASVDEVKPVKEAVVVNVEVVAEPMPEPPVVIELPKETAEVILGSDYDLDKEILMANKLALIAGLGDIKGSMVNVSLKQFYNEGKDVPFLSRHHVNVTILDDTIFKNEVKNRYINIANLGTDLELYLRKKGALSWNKDYTPKEVALRLK